MNFFYTADMYCVLVLHFIFFMEGCRQFPPCTKSQETFQSSVQQSPEICGDCHFQDFGKKT